MKGNAEKQLASVLSSTLFRGRATLYVREVAQALRISENQVLNLIEEGRLKAIDISRGERSSANPKGNKTSRKHWRIPVSDYDAFIHQQQS